MKDLRKYRKEIRRKELELEKHPWQLLENGRVIETYPSHTKAKNAMHWKMKEAENDWLDFYYEIREIQK